MAASRQRDPSFDDAAQQILRARREGRLVDASIGLERWVASCRQPSSAGASSSLPEMSSGLQTMGSSGMLSKLAARSGLGRQGSTVSSSLSSGDDAEEEMVASLRERMPRLRKLVEKEGVAGESVYLAAICLKHNERGKVQERLLLVSDQAVYNLKVDGKKVVCKRRCACRPSRAAASATPPADQPPPCMRHTRSSGCPPAAVVLCAPQDPALPHCVRHHQRAALTIRAPRSV